MKAWLFSAWSSLRSSEKASQHSLNATIWPLQALKLWLVSQCDNMISQRKYCNAVMITMHYTLYIQRRHTVVPWPCCLRGQSEAFKWSSNTLEKAPIYSILTSPRQSSPNFMDLLIFLALWQNDSLLGGSSLHCMFCVYLTSERRAGICHLAVLLFQSCTTNRSLQAIKT